MKKIQFLCTTVLCLIITFTQAQKPTITSFSPLTGAAGTSLTISGTNFNTTLASNVVYFGATKATVTAATATSLTVTIPAGSTYRPISVTNTASALTGFSSNYFPPTFTGGYKTSLQSLTTINNTFQSYAYKTVAADFDNDGKPDLACASRNNYFSYHRNLSTTTNIAFGTWLSYVYDANAGYSESLQAVDMDGDGKKDVLTLCSPTGQFASWPVYVARNTSSGTTISFSAPYTTIGFGASMNRVFATGDMDNDGKPDVLVLAQNSRVLISRNNSVSGTFTFVAPTTYNLPATFTPINMAVADFNADTKPDIILSGTNSGTPQLLYLRNTSTTAGNFAFAVDATATLPAAAVGNIAVGDLNNDGKPDFATTVAGKTLLVYTNSSTAASLAFTSAVQYTVASGYADLDVVTIGELNGDGAADITVNAYMQSNAVTYFNKNIAGTAAFDEVTQIAEDLATAGPEIADINGDGTNDFIAPVLQKLNIIYNAQPRPIVINSITPKTAQPGDQIVITGNYFNPVAANNVVDFGGVKGTVTQASFTSLTVNVPAGAAYKELTVFNADSKYTGRSPYAFTPKYESCGTYNDSSFSAKADVSITSSSGAGIIYQDINNDGKPDMIVADEINSKLTVYQNISTTGNLSSSSFGPAVTFLAHPGPVSLAAADLNGDGKAEIIIVNTGYRSALVYRNTHTSGDISTSSLELSGIYLIGVNSSPQPVSITTGDIDADGRLDMAIANRAGGTVTILLNNTEAGMPYFSFYPYELNVGSNPNWVTLADIDGDKKPEVIAAVSALNKISVFYNKSTAGVASFNPRVDFAVGNQPTSIAAGDLNDDGKVDLAVSNSANSTLSIFKNAMTTTGAITTASFSAPFTLATGTTPTIVGISDFSGDGKPDLITTNAGANTVSVYLNNSSSASFSSSTFSAAKAFPTGVNPAGLSTTDIDGDGFTDLAVGTGGGAGMSFLKGHGLTYSAITGTTKTSQGAYCMQGSAYKFYSDADPTIALFSINDPDQNYYGLPAGDVYVDEALIELSGKFFLQRHYAIYTEEQPYGPVQIRLYFTEAEFNALKQADPTVTSIADLYVTKYDGPGVDGAMDFSQATSLRSITPADITTGREYGSYYLEFWVDEFSEFWIHSQAAALPVKLIAFAADLGTKDVTLNWTTSAELNASHFEMEKSVDGRNFKTIGKVPASRTPSSANHYRFSDPELPAPLSYYRLKQVDRDDAFTYSNVLSVSKSGADLQVQIAPNPLQDRAVLTIKGSLKNAELQLFTASGKIVLRQKLGNTSNTSSTLIERGKLNSGLYYYTITSNGGSVKTGKLIIR